MRKQKPGNDPHALPQTRDFGSFYPVGHLVIAFPNEDDARQVQQDLTAGGYERGDCELYSSEEVAEAAERNLTEDTGLLGRLGWSNDAVKIHLDAAREGATFLLVHAPGDDEADRVMNVVRRVPFRFAHRYHRLVIEELD